MVVAILLCRLEGVIGNPKEDRLLAADNQCHSWIEVVNCEFQHKIGALFQFQQALIYQRSPGGRKRPREQLSRIMVGCKSSHLYCVTDHNFGLRPRVINWVNWEDLMSELMLSAAEQILTALAESPGLGEGWVIDDRFTNVVMRV